MNVLARMIIPKLHLTVRYILSEIEELEREDTFRLKRVKEKKMKKVKKDGAGEQIKNEDFIKPKKDEALKPEGATPVEETKPSLDYKETPIMAQPKEAAGMGDLIIIKASDNRMEVGDSFIPPPQSKTMGTFTEVEELVEDISNFDEKDKDEKRIESQPDDKNIEVDKNIAGNLETGEWFETPSQPENRANIINTQVSEYSEMDENKEVIKNKRNTDTKSTDVIPLKADKSVMDLDKRALVSLYKGIDSNFYLPTTVEVSNHDIATKDSVSLRDISVVEYSLVDLESIDFSIDSKGKVVFSKNDTGQSLPLSPKRQDTDSLKSEAKYDEDGILIGTTSGLASVKWLGDGVTKVNEIRSQYEPAMKRERVEENLQYEPTVTDTGETDSVIDTNKVKLNTDNKNHVENELDESHESSLSSENSNPDNINDDDVLNKKSKISLEETEQIPKDTIPEEFKTERLLVEKYTELTEMKTSKSLSNKKLSRLSKEDNLGADKTSKLSTLIEESKEIQQLEDEKDIGSTVISETAALRNETEESLDKTSAHSYLKNYEVQEENFETVRSARSSIDLRSNDSRQENDRSRPSENKLSQNITQEEETNINNVAVPKTNREILEESSTKISQDSRRTTEQIEESKSLLWRDANFIIEESNKNGTLTDPTQINSRNNIPSETRDNTYQQAKVNNENKPLKILGSDEIIKRKDCTREQSKQNSQSKTDTTNGEAKGESQDNQKETEHKSKKEEMSIEKSLRILSSDEIVRSNEEYKRKSKDGQGKESETDKDKKGEQRDTNSDDERGSSDVSKRGKHSGDDHLKQE